MPELPDVHLYMACLTPRITAVPIGDVRILSRLLRKDWPGTLEELEAR